MHLDMDCNISSCEELYGLHVMLKTFVAYNGDTVCCIFIMEKFYDKKIVKSGFFILNIFLFFLFFIIL